MRYFMKTERFTKIASSEPLSYRKEVIQEHKRWVQGLKDDKGMKVKSGYLVDGEGKPGGGGVLLFQANSYGEARDLVLGDPMIARGLVDFELHEVRHEDGAETGSERTESYSFPFRSCASPQSGSL